MRILMINVDCGTGSTGRICTDLAEALEKQGHEVRIAYGRDVIPQKNAIRIGNDFDVYGHVLQARLFDRMGFGSKRATKKFIEWVKEYDPDVIHLHNIHGYYINIEVLFSYLKTCGKKIIWTLHDCWAFTGHTPYCDVVNCKRWENGCHNCPLKWSYPKSIIDRSHDNWEKKKSIFEGLDDLVVITPSKWLSKNVKSSFLCKYQVNVINNGIDTTKFSFVESDFKASHGIEKKFMLLGVATSWDDMKGYSDYLKLAEILGSDFQVVLIGLTKKQIKRLPTNVVGIERTSGIKELAEIYSAADLYINLSYCENYPTVNIEAMACGTPVLTYRSGGSPEIVEKYGGVIVERGDVESVAKKCLEIKNGVREIKMVFDVKENDYSATIKKYIQMYLCNT